MDDQDSTRDSKRFDLALFIVHPNIDPTEISAALDLEGQFQHRFGDERRTPTGTALPGTYGDSRWRHVIRYDTDQHFANQIASFVNGLVAHKAYFAKLASEGASLQIIIQFLGDGHYGDTVPGTVLAQINELGLDLGVEVFSTRQK